MSECALSGFFGDLYLMQVFFSVVFATVLPYCIVTFSIFIYKRKKQPMVARPFRTTVAGFIALMLWITELCFVYILREGHSCVWFLIFGWPLLALTLNIYLSRVWLLWFKFKSTQEKSTLPPLRSVSFNLSSLEQIRTRVRTYTSRKSMHSSSVYRKSTAGGSENGEHINGRTSVREHVRRACRTSTVTFAPSVELFDSRASISSATGSLLDGNGLELEFEGFDEGDCNHAATAITAQGTAQNRENRHEGAVSPLTSPSRSHVCQAVASPCHPRSGGAANAGALTSSDAMTLTDELGACAGGHCNTAPTSAARETLLHQGNTHHTTVSPATSHLYDCPAVLRSSSHSRSDAVTLTRVELSKTLATPVPAVSTTVAAISTPVTASSSSAQGDTSLRVDSDESQIPSARRVLAVATTVPAISTTVPAITTLMPDISIPVPVTLQTTPPFQSRDRGSESYTSNNSTHCQFVNHIQGADGSVYVHISNDSTAEPSLRRTLSDSELAPVTRTSVFDDMVPVPSPAEAVGAAPPTIAAPAFPSTQTPIHWYLNHKHYGSDRFMLRWFGLKGLIEWLVLMAPVYTGDGAVFRENLSDECFCPSLIWALYAFQGIVIYHALIVGYAAWRFVQIKDGFYLKAEFKYISIICLVGLILWNVLGFVPGNNHVFPFTNFWMIIVTVGVFAMSSSYPLWMSRKRGMRTTRSATDSVSSSRMSQPSVGGCNSALYSFLTETDSGIQEFAEHLQREFSIENLLFWQAVEQYHSEFDDEQPKANRELALEIESRFINDESELQVNLDSTDYRSVHESIANDKITIDLFDTASSHIFRLMAADSFIRFRNQRKESLRGD